MRRVPKWMIATVQAMTVGVVLGVLGLLTGDTYLIVSSSVWLGVAFIVAGEDRRGR